MRTELGRPNQVGSAGIGSSICSSPALVLKDFIVFIAVVIVVFVAVDKNSDKPNVIRNDHGNNGIPGNEPQERGMLGKSR